MYFYFNLILKNREKNETKKSCGLKKYNDAKIITNKQQKWLQGCN